MGGKIGNKETGQQIEKSNKYGFPDLSRFKESACNSGDIGDVGSILSQKDPLDGEMVAAPVFFT